MDACYSSGNSEESGIYRAVVIRKFDKPSYKLDYRKAIPLEELELIPAAHEAIISKEEFAQAQQIRKDHRVSYFDKNKEPHKYVGLLFCGKCKTAMRNGILLHVKDMTDMSVDFIRRWGEITAN